MSTFKIAIGDPSDNGHGKVYYKKVNCNKSTKELGLAYKQSCELTGLVFTENTSIIVDGLLIDYNHLEYNDRKVCIDYESYYPSDLAWEILKKFGIKQTKENDFCCDTLAELFMRFLGLSLLDLKYEFIEDKEKVLNLTIGYGLFE